ncbi:SDR family NAD(P)-dependent oxidoreductase [Candidatus Sumerlaeota bacterium]|nr:SDR family NAD(P)-dependent oxidoreductase [Candidatus Sumerlaeota bacterium]
MAQRVLITGGAGFIGSHLADLLLKEGYAVRVLDNLEPQVHGPNAARPAYLHSDVEFIQGDVRDPEAVARALQDVDLVSHQAALVGVGQSMYEIARYTEINALGTARLLDAIVQTPAIRDRMQRIVVASSMSCYGEGKAYHRSCGEFAPPLRTIKQMQREEWEILAPNDEPCEARPTDEEHPMRPTSVYAASKHNQEQLVLATGLAYGIAAVALRYFGVYGSRQSLSNPYTGVGAIFSSSLLNGRPPLVYEDGKQTRDFIHVSDIARANLLALREESVRNGAFNVGTGRRISILELARMLSEKITGGNIEPEITKRFRSGDVRHCFADTKQARDWLGFYAQVALEDGIDELVESVRAQTPPDRRDEAHDELQKHGLVK